MLLLSKCTVIFVTKSKKIVYVIRRKQQDEEQK